jgi:hypothetical protein
VAPNETGLDADEDPAEVYISAEAVSIPEKGTGRTKWEGIKKVKEGGWRRE